MVTVGIIGAMDEEISLLKSHAEIISAKNIVGNDYYVCKLSGKNVVLVRSGIGKVNAAICAQILIDLFAVDYIINIGVAGALDNDLRICDVVVSSDLVHHDMDATAFGHQLGAIPRMPLSIFPADDELINLAVSASEKLNLSVNVVVDRIASGDKFVSNINDKKFIHSTFKAACVEMEGAAIAQTAYLNKLPFVVIRAISDTADDNASMSFDTFVAKAAEISSKLVFEMLSGL